MTKLAKKIAEEKAYDMVINNDIQDFRKLTDEDKYQLTSYLLEQDEYTEGFGADNKDFDRMQTAMLRCMRNPTDAAKIDLANTLLDCVSSYYAPQADKLIVSIDEKRDMFREAYDYEA